MKVLVCGTCARNTDEDFNAVYNRLVSLPLDTTILHGCAMGPDVFAGELATFFRFKVQEFPPLRSDARAGINPFEARNLRMLDQSPDLVIAFWDGQSGGTNHTMENARKRGIPVEVIL